MMQNSCDGESLSITKTTEPHHWKRGDSIWSFYIESCI